MRNKTIAIYPGTFDPITKGHIDIIDRANKIFDEVIVTLALNQTKKPLFDIAERMVMIKDAINGLENVKVAQFDGLLVNFAEKNGANVIIRGLRAVSDFEYEFQMALMNKKLSREITTIFMMPNEKYTYLNSTIVKDVAKFNGNVDNFVTKLVAEKLSKKFKEQSQ
jgi:pantetheine-phosphate adenylyltransferase